MIWVSIGLAALALVAAVMTFYVALLNAERIKRIRDDLKTHTDQDFLVGHRMKGFR